MRDAPHDEGIESIDRDGMALYRQVRRARRAPVGSRKESPARAGVAARAAMKLETRRDLPLTKIQHRAHHALTHSPEPVRAIAARSGLTGDQTKGALKFLQAKDLAVYTQGGWRAAS